MIRVHPIIFRALLNELDAVIEQLDIVEPATLTMRTAVDKSLDAKILGKAAPAALLFDGDVEVFQATIRTFRVNLGILVRQLNEVRSLDVGTTPLPDPDSAPEEEDRYAIPPPPKSPRE